MAVKDSSQMQRRQAQGRERAAGPTGAEGLTVNLTDGHSWALRQESGLAAGSLRGCDSESPPVTLYPHHVDAAVCTTGCCRDENVGMIPSWEM